MAWTELPWQLTITSGHFVDKKEGVATVIVVKGDRQDAKNAKTQRGNMVFQPRSTPNTRNRNARTKMRMSAAW
jgi:hypothetical protein